MSGGGMTDFLVELWSCTKERKTYRLLPIVLCLVLLALLVVVTSGTAGALADIPEVGYTSG